MADLAMARLRVTDGGAPVALLNELEFAGGALWANVWQSPRIARIDPVTGVVTGWLDLSALPGPMFAGPRIDVLNGIAWDAAGRRLLVTGKAQPPPPLPVTSRSDLLLVTGKLWPRLFALEVEGLNEAD